MVGEGRVWLLVVDWLPGWLLGAQMERYAQETESEPADRAVRPVNICIIFTDNHTAPTNSFEKLSMVIISHGFDLRIFNRPTDRTRRDGASGLSSAIGEVLGVRNRTRGEERARRIEMIDISMMEREGASRGECGRRIEFVRSADCVTHCTAV